MQKRKVNRAKNATLKHFIWCLEKSPVTASVDHLTTNPTTEVMRRDRQSVYLEKELLLFDHKARVLPSFLQ